MDYLVVSSLNEETVKSTHVIFDLHEYLVDVLRSYTHQWEKIWHQFLIDFPRIKVRLNGVFATDPEEFYRNVLYNKTIIILCTQAALAMPFDTISSVYANNQGISLVDVREDGTLVDIAQGVVEITKSLQLFHCERNERIAFVRLSLDIDQRQPFASLNWTLE